jgi:hypothetical protein
MFTDGTERGMFFNEPPVLILIDDTGKPLFLPG